MVRIIEVKTETGIQLSEELKRVSPSADEAVPACREIIEAVRTRGDDALVECTNRFDGVDLSQMGLRVTREEFDRAERDISSEMRDALAHAIRNIRRFHETQIPPLLSMVEVEPGVSCGDRFTPIDSVCLYVPRGRGAFASVMCMLGVPAVIANVPLVAVCTPPGPDGRVDDATLVAARMIGIDRVYRVGGAQAVAAVAYGTETVPKCSKLVGPGNIYVTAARNLLSDILDPGSPAGPSESAILCDATPDPARVAWNLLIEAEHGENSCAICVTHDRKQAERVAECVNRFMSRLSDSRRAFASQVLEENGGIIVTESFDSSIEVVNAYAAEHLAVMVENPWDILERIRNAGEILLGEYPVISLGNYAMGLNAILPTGGRAVTGSCVSVHDFLKRSSVGYVTKAGFDALSPVVSTMSRDEGFSAHHLAVENWNA